VRPPTQAEHAEVGSALAAWSAAGLDDVGACVEELPAVRVAVASTHAEMYSLTGYCGPSSEETRGTDREGDTWCRWGRAAGAYRRAQDGGAWPFALFSGDYPLIVAWGGLDPARLLSLVRHEAVHWLQDCTGRGWNPWRPHGDAEVWCLDGCPGRYRRAE
jgi:hypothetical protein